jgi:hypothetical protein
VREAAPVAVDTFGQEDMGAVLGDHEYMERCMNLGATGSIAELVHRLHVDRPQSRNVLPGYMHGVWV